MTGSTHGVIDVTDDRALHSRYLLAIIEPRDSLTHPMEYLQKGISPTDSIDHLLREFLESLPDDTKGVHAAEGSVQGVKKYMTVFQVPTLQGINVLYFARNIGTAVFEIPDRLKVTRHYRREDIDVKMRNFDIAEEGPVGAMVERYKGLVNTDGMKTLEADLFGNEDFRTRFTKGGVFVEIKSRSSIYVTIDLKTSDDTHILAATSERGPFEYTVDTPEQMQKLRERYALERQGIPQEPPK